MKKIYGFLGALAILSMVGCSKDDVEVGNGNQTSVKGDMYMSVAIRPVGNNGTRTATPGQGQEVGKDRENTITTALVIFAEKAGDDYQVVTGTLSGASGSDFQLTGNPQSNYMATFLVDRETLLTDIGSDDGEKEYYIFVIANPATLSNKYMGSDGKFTKGTNLQQLLETTGDTNDFWNADKFLMSNSEEVKKTIKAEEIKKGTHTEATDPYNLGTIKIQRAMSRFDLATDSNYTVFTATTEGRGDDLTTANSDLKDLTITFDAVALINMAQTANAFKVTEESADVLGTKKLVFGVENANNWVFSPEQTAFSTPLFSGAAADGVQTGSTVATGLQGFFATEASETEPLAVNRVGGYTKIANITETENSWSKNPTDKPTEVPTYSIWRYAMENTNPDDAENQLNGNSTGVVFRAEITGKKVDGTALTAEDGPLYAYNSVILGNAEELRDYAVNSKSDTDESGVYDAVILKYAAAVAEYNKKAETNKFTFEVDKRGTEGNDEWQPEEDSELAQGYKDIRKASATELAALDTYLVDNGGFSIYRPTNGHYYCYYIYWNRHNDNGDNSQMGPMEFATVRNNIYKLRVNKIHKLGHPGLPEDDPDDPTPDTPDEKDSFYCQVICEILPWEVRLNDIEF